MNESRPPLPAGARVVGVGSTSPATRAVPYDSLYRLTETAIEGLFRDWAGAPVSARPMTKLEREAASDLPDGLVDRESIAARSLTVSTDCPYCGTALVTHERGTLTLVCPR